MNLSLKGKNALVGGGSAGIGRAIAVELAALGANVTLMARNETRLQEAVSELTTDEGQIHDYVSVDYSDSAALIGAVNGLLESKIALHILINNTGGPAGGPIHKALAEDFLQAYHNHLLCNQLLVQALLPGMRAAAYGRIINVISTSVVEPIPGLGVSNTTRWAVAAWSKTLAGELAPAGITVNNVLPGFTDTERLTEIVRARARNEQKTEAEVAEAMKSTVPAGRFGTAQEVAAAAAFLASPAAAYITGTNIRVDGGRTKSL